MRPAVYSSGFLVLRNFDRPEFLLMKHANRWDLPKGHLDFGETKKEAALRELWEETGIPEDAIWIDPDFLYENQYRVQYNKLERPRLKELSLYLALLQRPVELQLTEHASYQWFAWSPPHQLQAQTIDPLLAAAHTHIATSSAWADFQ